MKSLIIMALLAVMSVVAHSQDNKPLTVVGVGSTFEEAKNNGFSKAIEFSVGSAILSEKEVRGATVARDEIIKYSAGYVDDFKVIDQNEHNGKVYVTLEVVVKSSKIHERLLGKSSSSTNFNGDRLDTQYKTYMEERETGDKFLSAILKDYPEHGFIVTQGKPEFKLTLYRESVIEIPYTVTWNYNFLTALNEALDKVQSGSSREYYNLSCLCYKSPERITVLSRKPGDIFGSNTSYHFNEESRPFQVQAALAGSQEARIRTRIFNTNGEVIYTSCLNLDVTFFGKRDAHQFVFYGNAEEKGTIEIVVNRNEKLQREFSTTGRIEVSMSSVTNCY